MRRTDRAKHILHHFRIWVARPLVVELIHSIAHSTTRAHGIVLYEQAFFTFVLFKSISISTSQPRRRAIAGKEPFRRILTHPCFPSIVIIEIWILIVSAAHCTCQNWVRGFKIAINPTMPGTVAGKVPRTVEVLNGFIGAGKPYVAQISVHGTTKFSVTINALLKNLTLIFNFNIITDLEFLKLVERKNF